MSRRWKFVDSRALYFVSYAVVQWVDVFVRNEYKQELIASLKYCQEHKGLDLYGWCIMPSHVHLIIGSEIMPLEHILRDMKRHTSEKLHELIENHPQESRKKWMLSMFEQAGINNSNNRRWQFWQQNNKPILLRNQEMTMRTLNYIHNNPVISGFVEEPCHWIYSSALDYSGRQGFLNIRLLE